ncbi:Rnf-Nqr domain containing protein [Haploplasma axanthum]|uniref:Nitrogen fixation protein rnfA n=1 Tax=Haploplasma axanthum TaxID=29552 RepID=A0A449BBR0_HAPAX|nr:Rnf-Nqr domain containing protein [Haploplasma axanthum]VEU79665.1 Nitrogen fixation protein rnfA [Haploplasma axanthum]
MTYIAIIFSAVFLSNILLSSLVGFPFLGKDVSLRKVLVIGIKTLIISLFTGVIVYPISKFLLEPESWTFLTIIITVLVAANITLGVNALSKKLKVEEEVTNELELFAPFNAVIVVSSLLVATNQTYLGAVANIIGLGLGYILVTLMLFMIKPRLDLPGLPKAFRGIPILLVTLGLIAMVFMGLSGIF